MPRYSIKLRRAAESFIHEYECDADDLGGATAVADAMAVAGGGGFDTPEVALVGCEGRERAQSDASNT